MSTSSGTHHILGATNVIAVILTSGFAQMIVLGIPLVLGLLWNKWAGGAAGFIMGGMYYVASAGLYTRYYASSERHIQLFRRHEHARIPRYGCYHWLHGWSIEQRINEFQTNARRRLDSRSNNRNNPSLS